MKCQRCGEKMLAHTMSFFNTDTICIPCSDDEKGAPNFQQAREADYAAVHRGDYNFPGLGLAPADRAYLSLRIAARRAAR